MVENTCPVRNGSVRGRDRPTMASEVPVSQPPQGLQFVCPLGTVLRCEGTNTVHKKKETIGNSTESFSIFLYPKTK